MKLYFSPGACSLAGHIALHEAGVDFEWVKVDLKAKTTEHGDDFKTINPKGYVPALQFDDGQVLTENVAILDWIADQDAQLAPAGDLGRYRLLEMLAFISTEVHKSFKPFFQGGSDEQKQQAKAQIEKRFGEIEGMVQGDYLFGDRPSVADAYLFVMLLWANKNGVDAPAGLRALYDRMGKRDAVRMAFEHEGLGTP